MTRKTRRDNDLLRAALEAERNAKRWRLWLARADIHRRCGYVPPLGVVRG